MNLRALQILLNQKHIPFKPTSKADEIAINCPICKESRFRMQVNPQVVSKGGIVGWAFCYRRWHGIPFQRLLEILHIDVESIDDVTITRTSFEAFHNRMREVKSPDYLSEPTSVRITGIELGQFNQIIPATSYPAKRALTYLHQRGFTEDTVAKYRLMYDPFGDYKDRVVIPFYENGRALYFQARDITGYAKSKILNPTKLGSNLGKSDLLFNFDQAKKHKQARICEGWASAMSAGLNGVAISGKVASDRQLHLLLTNWKDFWCCWIMEQSVKPLSWLENSSNQTTGSV